MRYVFKILMCLTLLLNFTHCSTKKQNYGVIPSNAPTPESSPTSTPDASKGGSTPSPPPSAVNNILDSSLTFSPKKTGVGNIQAIRLNNQHHIFVRDEKNHIYATSGLFGSQPWTALISVPVQDFKVIQSESYIYVFAVTENRLNTCRFQHLEADACKLEVHSQGLKPPSGQLEYGIAKFDVIAPKAKNDPLGFIHLVVHLGPPINMREASLSVVIDPSKMTDQVRAIIVKPEISSSSSPVGTPTSLSSVASIYTSVLPISQVEGQVSADSFQHSAHNGFFGKWEPLSPLVPASDTSKWPIPSASVQSLKLGYVASTDSEVEQGAPFSDYTVALFILFSSSQENRLYRYYRLWNAATWKPFSTHNPIRPSNLDNYKPTSLVGPISHPNGCSAAILLHPSQQATTFDVNVLSFQPKKSLPCSDQRKIEITDMYQTSVPDFEFVGEIEKIANSPDTPGTETPESPYTIELQMNGSGELYYFSILSGKLNLRTITNLPVVSRNQPANNSIGLPYSTKDILLNKSIEGLQIKNFSTILDDSLESMPFYVYAIGHPPNQNQTTVCFSSEGKGWDCLKIKE